ncbi:MAG: hypothetical protein HY815_24215 [Candidatus Riflebacteria bacterium]|nr:hypothetical protein [Candidatus Riflebacteria bacterium]
MIATRFRPGGKLTIKARLWGPSGDRICRVALLLVVAIRIGPACADTLVFKNGGHIQGIVTERGDTVTVRVPEGTIEYRRDLVAAIRRGSTPLEEYEKARAALTPQDVSGHYTLGLYCERMGLVAQAATEFREVVALQKDHTEARRKLGHVFVNGCWITVAEDMRRKGYVKVNDKWLSPQEMAARQQQLKERLRRQGAARPGARTAPTRSRSGAGAVQRPGELQRALEQQLQGLSTLDLETIRARLQEQLKLLNQR